MKKSGERLRVVGHAGPEIADLENLVVAENQRKQQLADENSRLRAAGECVVAAFEALGRTTDAGALLQARSRCESAMVALREALNGPQ